MFDNAGEMSREANTKFGLDGWKGLVKHNSNCKDTHEGMIIFMFDSDGKWKRGQYRVWA